jgi:hypothetical protein
MIKQVNSIISREFKWDAGVCISPTRGIEFIFIKTFYSKLGQVNKCFLSLCFIKKKGGKGKKNFVVVVFS